MTIREFIAGQMAEFYKAQKGNEGKVVHPTKVVLPNCLAKALIEELRASGMNEEDLRLKVLFGAKVTTSYEPIIKFS